MDFTKLIGRLIGTNNSLTNNRLLIDYANGNHAEAQFLSQLLYWSSRSRLEGGWFAKSYEELHDEIRVSERSLRRFGNKYKEIGIIERDLRHWNGRPTVHYRVFTEKLLQELCDLAGQIDAKERIEQELQGEQPPGPAPTPPSQPEQPARDVAVWHQTLRADQVWLESVARYKQCGVGEVQQVLDLFVQDKQMIGEDAQWHKYADMRSHFYHWVKKINIEEKINPSPNGNRKHKKGLHANGHVIDEAGASEVLARLGAKDSH